MADDDECGAVVLWYVFIPSAHGQGWGVADVEVLACDVTIEGREYSALSWGLLASNGSMPPGCRVTVVKKRYDVQVRC